MKRLIIYSLSIVMGLGLAAFSASAQDRPLSNTIQGGVLNGKATSLPKPSYPAEARAARVSGTVKVQVIIDEYGNVVSATAVSGDPLLQGVSAEAARLAKFSPTTLSGNPVKVAGVITYNFVLDTPAATLGEKGLLKEIPITDRDSIWGVGMLFAFIQTVDSEIIRMVGNEQGFYNILNDLAQEVPGDMTAYKPILERVRSTDSVTRAEAAREFLKMVRQEFNQEQNWQVDVGEQLGLLVGEMLRQRLQYVKTGVAYDAKVLRLRLRRLSDLLANAPTGVSPLLKKKFSKIAAFAEDPNLANDAKFETLMGAIEPLFEEFGPH